MSMNEIEWMNGSNSELIFIHPNNHSFILKSLSPTFSISGNFTPDNSHPSIYSFLFYQTIL